VQVPFVVRLAQTIDPLRCGPESDPVARLTSSDPQGNGKVRLSRSRGAQEDDVVLGLDEVESAKMDDDFFRTER
jgi:hypothetical protein